MEEYFTVAFSAFVVSAKLINSYHIYHFLPLFSSVATVFYILTFKECHIFHFLLPSIVFLFKVDNLACFKLKAIISYAFSWLCLLFSPEFFSTSNQVFLWSIFIHYAVAKTWFLVKTSDVDTGVYKKFNIWF